MSKCYQLKHMPLVMLHILYKVIYIWQRRCDLRELTGNFKWLPLIAELRSVYFSAKCLHSFKQLAWASLVAQQ